MSDTDSFVSSSSMFSSIVFKLFNTLLLSIPSFVLKILSTDFQITLPLSTLLIILALIVGLGVLIVRYKVLTRYSKNTTKVNSLQDHTSNKGIDIVESVKKKGDPSKASTNYLDEFLSAIKVFGYLEKPVFHELTKNMTTQRVESDEIIHLDEGLGFLIVVEGTIQVFIQVKGVKEGDVVSSKAEGDADVEIDGEVEDDEDMDEDFKRDTLKIGSQKYRLLNEVKSGAPLSSLISTLDLFKKEEFGDRFLSTNALNSPLLSPKFTMANDSFSLDDTSPLGPPGGKSSDTQIPITYPEVVARPKSDPNSSQNNSATIAIIPRLAFERVQNKYPRASSHIVTMVIARLFKVTMNTIHDYLGLTREIMESEIKLNKIGEIEDYHLPSYLREGVIEKFKHQMNNPNSNDDSSYPAMNNQITLTKRNTKASNSIRAGKNSSRYVVLDSRSKSTHPGDLLSSVPLSRRSDYYQTHTTIPQEEEKPSLRREFSTIVPPATGSSRHTTAHPSSASISASLSFSADREETEDTSLRIAVVENIFKHLGINELELALMMQDYPRYLVSGHRHSLSKSTSAVGLTSLMSGNHTQSTTPPNGSMGFYRDHSYKYFTINQADYFADQKNQEQGNNTNIQNENNETKRRTRLNRNSISFQPDFDGIKREFSKYLEIKHYPPNTTLVEQGKFDSGMFYVIDGSLDVLLSSTSFETGKKTVKRLYSVKVGGLAGYLSSIVGFRSLVSIKTPKDGQGVIVAHILKRSLSTLSDKFYFLQLPIANKLKNLLSKKILTIDYALEWCHIPAGNILCAQGDMANGFHIVLSGRFRAVTSKSKLDRDEERPDDDLRYLSEDKRSVDKEAEEDIVVLGEYGHGESLGEIEVLTASRRKSSLIAVRDSETARIPRTLFEMLSIQNPSIMIKVSRIVANRMGNNASVNQFASQSPHQTISLSTSPYISTDYKTITILPTTHGLPVREFADKLVNAFRDIGRKVISLDQASTLTHLGRHAFDERLAQLKLSGYFAYLEEEYETIVYICDSPLRSNWTSTCISQGDCVLLLADAMDKENAINIGDYEKVLLKQKTTARTELCLIHPDRYVEAGSTSVWLKNRIWVQGHHHIQMEITRDSNHHTTSVTSTLITPSAIISGFAAKLSNNAASFENVKTLSSIVNLASRRLRKRGKTPGISNNVAPHKNDFLRLARILSNEAVGLVLGGGGSRGISHVGIVAALEKHGIPIDLIGGTSIGSFVGGLYAKDYNSVSIYGRAKIFSMRVSSIWRSILDLTYPVTSYITGYEFNRGIWKTFRNSEIEDFWLRYFCNSTNITNSTMDIHETGYLWRFIRASMSLAGLLPPIAFDGCMLLDGGYLDNLPVLEMKKKGAKYIIAVDVGSVDERTPMNYGDTLSGFWVLFNRWNPFLNHANVPNMTDIQLRLAYVASVNALEIAKKTPGVIYLRPPIDNYATLDFGKFDEIYHVGLDYADKLFTQWENTDKLPAIAGRERKGEKEHGSRRLQRRNSI